MEKDLNWRVWEKYESSYGEFLYKRATGELPEMESSKKVATQLKDLMVSGDTLLDVGCGPGHYLKSFRRIIGDHFDYTGVDVTPQYVELAKKAFAQDSKARFTQGDIYALAMESRSFDYVTCNNVFLHLPSLQKPLSELIRVARKGLIIRFLIGDRSFRIQDVYPEADGREFTEDGEPTRFYYYNIYSKNYIGHLCSLHPEIKSWTIEADQSFSKANITQARADRNTYNASYMLGDYQVNGYILQPWSLLKILL